MENAEVDFSQLITEAKINAEANRYAFLKKASSKRIIKEVIQKSWTRR